MWSPARAFAQLTAAEGSTIEGSPLFRPLLALRVYVELSNIEDSFSRWELLLPGVFVLDEIHGNAGAQSALLCKGEIEWNK